MADLITMLSAAAGAGGEYQISRSLRFNSADSAYLSRTPGSAGNRRTFTWSTWIKKSRNAVDFEGIFATENGIDQIRWQNDDKLLIGLNSASSALLVTTQVFRDVGAWGHLVVAFDTTQATDANRIKVYWNGVQITAFGTETYPPQNHDCSFNNNVIQRIGTPNGTELYLSGYLTEINFIDGQQLTPSSFGEINPDTGVWQPIKYAGSYGTNGFYLNFSDNSNTTASTLGKDYSGNGNNWTPNNFSVTAGAGNDSLVDVPTRNTEDVDTGAGGEVRGNYCIGNWNNSSSTDILTNGALDWGCDNTRVATGTFGMSSGKWYCEGTVSAITSTLEIGIVGAQRSFTNIYTAPGSFADGYIYLSDGNKYNNNSSTAYGASYTTNDVIGIAFDADAGTITFYKNGVSQGTAFSNITAGTYVICARGTGVGPADFLMNFGQRPFAYTAPSGFKALVTTNLPDPTVVQGDEYFNTVLYTGTGSSQSITGVGFQPDFVWIKERNAAADHALYDAVRGVQQQLESNTTTDETTESTGLTAFGSDGFTVGSLAQVNTSTDTYVAWNWKESTVSKFDIVTYTGNGTARTISHNLGVVPNMIIVKARTTASTDQGWPVYHSANTANPETDYLLLNDTAATADLDTVWNDTAPTSSVFSVGTNALVNANNDTYVAYLFANVAGYSAFGSYTGNASTDGPFVYTGFRPAWVLIKCSSTAPLGWFIFDSKRDTYNAVDLFLKPNTSEAESSTLDMDFTANGFKIRNTNGNINGNATTHIYAAFAENPVKFSLAR